MPPFPPKPSPHHAPGVELDHEDEAWVDVEEHWFEGGHPTEHKTEGGHPTEHKTEGGHPTEHQAQGGHPTEHQAQGGHPTAQPHSSEAGHLDEGERPTQPPPSSRRSAPPPLPAQAPRPPTVPPPLPPSGRASTPPPLPPSGRATEPAPVASAALPFPRGTSPGSLDRTAPGSSPRPFAEQGRVGRLEPPAGPKPRPSWLRDELLGFSPAPARSRRPALPRAPLLDDEERAPSLPAPAALAPSHGSMFEAVAEGRWADALRLAESILQSRPDDDDALQCAQLARGELKPPPSTLAGPDAIPSTAPTPTVDLGADELSVEINRMLERLASGNYPSALMMAEAILDRQPANRDAEQCASMCRSELRRVYAGKLGSLGRAPRLAAPDAPPPSLDAEASLLLSKVDGLASFKDIVESSGLPMLEALRSLYELLVEGLIEID